jgi:hypothetical protein
MRVQGYIVIRPPSMTSACPVCNWRVGSEEKQRVVELVGLRDAPEMVGAWRANTLMTSTF